MLFTKRTLRDVLRKPDGEEFLISLFEDYSAAVRIVHLETGWEENLHRNADRAAVVPEHVVEDMLGKLVPPQRWKAQCVEWHCV